MPASRLTWYKTKTNRIMRDIRTVKQKEIAQEINESIATVSYRLKNVYPRFLEDMIRILDLAGYEIKEKEEE